MIGSPLFFGFVFGPNAVIGLLPGALVSSVNLAISSSNSGGAWFLFIISGIIVRNSMSLKGVKDKMSIKYYLL